MGRESTPTEAAPLPPPSLSCLSPWLLLVSLSSSLNLAALYELQFKGLELKRQKKQKRTQ